MKVIWALLRKTLRVHVMSENFNLMLERRSVLLNSHQWLGLCFPSLFLTHTHTEEWWQNEASTWHTQTHTQTVQEAIRVKTADYTLLNLLFCGEQFVCGADCRQFALQHGQSDLMTHREHEDKRGAAQNRCPLWPQDEPAGVPTEAQLKPPHTEDKAAGRSSFSVMLGRPC